MKIAFLSNFFNHHQKPLSDALYALTEGDFRFIATVPLPEERRKLGYSDSIPDYVIKGDDPRNAQQARQWIDSADVVISGFVSEELLDDRKKEKKLIFRFSERPLKKGRELFKYPYRWLNWRKNNPRRAAIYLLCAGAYTAQDYASYGMFRNKMFKWGYFPEQKRFENFGQLMSQKDPKELLWCGRFLDWKHPDDALVLAKRLRDDGVSFRLSVVGTGEMEETLRTFCQANRLDDVVSFLGAVSPQEVRRKMEGAGIFLLTSDRKEGWGAVLNEAMNSGCAVVSSIEAGSTPYLIQNEVNGYVFRSGDMDALYQKVRLLLRQPDEQRRLGEAAYHTICEDWNAQIAAQRLVAVSQTLLKGEDATSLYPSGPCSSAEKIIC